MVTKKCTKCGKEKPLSEFNKNKTTKDGHRFQCRECQKESGVLYRKRNVEKGKIYRKKYYQDHKEERADYQRRNKDSVNINKKRYVERNPEKRKQQSRNYYHRHREEIKERAQAKKEETNKKRVEYIHNNTNAKLAHNYRTLILRAMGRKNVKHSRSTELLGCSIEDFKLYLSSLWVDNMDWTNYGKGRSKWSIDHIIPISYFNLNNWEEAKKAYHYTNCVPMWYSQNASKSNRYSGGYKSMG